MDNRWIYNSYKIKTNNLVCSLGFFESRLHRNKLSSREVPDEEIEARYVISIESSICLAPLIYELIQGIFGIYV